MLGRCGITSISVGSSSVSSMSISSSSGDEWGGSFAPSIVISRSSLASSSESSPSIVGRVVEPWRGDFEIGSGLPVAERLAWEGELIIRPEVGARFGSATRILSGCEHVS